MAVPEESKAVSSSADCKPVHIDPIDEKPVVDEPETGDPTPDAPAVPTPTPAVAYLFGAGVLTPAALPTLLGRARVRPITHPGDAPPEMQYRPSAAGAGLRALPGPDLPLPRLRQTRLRL